VSNDSTQIPFEHNNSDPLSLLGDILAVLPADSVILLRPTSAYFNSDVDDIDLLVTAGLRDTLLQTAYQFATDGRLHFRIQQTRDEKIRLTLWNMDATQSLKIDLWSSITQCGRWMRSTAIPAETLFPYRIRSNSAGADSNATDPLERWPAICRLPAAFELCLYLLHLATKRRDLQSSSVTERLSLLRGRLLSRTTPGTRWLVDLTERVSALPQLTATEWIPALCYLEQQCGDDDLLRRRPRQYRRRVVAGLRHWLTDATPWIEFSGCDGIGKSTILRRIANSGHGMRVGVAKKLYRHSLTYQLLGGIIRRCCRWSRCRLDDQFASLLTLRAAVTWCLFLLLRRMSPVRQPTVLLDRSVADTLIRDRKTDTPQLAAIAPLIAPVLASVSSVQLIAGWSTLQSRKAEMTAAGCERYQQLLFRRALNSHACDVLLFSNVGDEVPSSLALTRCLQSCWSHRVAENRDAVTPNSAVVACPVERRVA
jgi:hypothetical protein